MLIKSTTSIYGKSVLELHLSVAILLAKENQWKFFPKQWESAKKNLKLIILQFKLKTQPIQIVQRHVLKTLMPALESANTLKSMPMEQLSKEKVMKMSMNMGIIIELFFFSS